MSQLLQFLRKWSVKVNIFCFLAQSAISVCFCFISCINLEWRTQADACRCCRVNCFLGQLFLTKFNSQFPLSPTLNIQELGLGGYGNLQSTHWSYLCSTLYTLFHFHFTGIWVDLLKHKYVCLLLIFTFTLSKMKSKAVSELWLKLYREGSYQTLSKLSVNYYKNNIYVLTPGTYKKGWLPPRLWGFSEFFPSW